jgi:catechol-2,3-dioxygenase
MKLNHINLVITDISTAIHLFEKHFGFKCSQIKGDNIVAILKGADDFTLVLMTSKDGDFKFPSAFHIGFMQATTQAVADIYQSLKNSGVNVGQEPRNIRDSFGFYFLFDNLMIEVGHYLN